MAESFSLPDGQAVSIDAATVEQEFARAMATPAEEPPAPPKKEAVAEPAPEKPKRRGRPPKSEKARVKKAPEPPSDKDYTEEVTGLVTGAWLTLASIGPTQAYAYPISEHQDQLISALAAGAKNNSTIRGYVEKLSSGGGGIWTVQLALVGAQIAMDAMAISKKPELREQAAAVTKQQLAAAVAKVQTKPEPEPENGTDDDGPKVF